MGTESKSQPLLDDGGVEPAEVVVGLKVALGQVLGPQGRISAVMAALDLVADHEGRAAGAVVGAGAVVLDAAAELGEQHHDQVVTGVMLGQVIEEVADGGGHVGPQLGVHRRLVEVGVEAAVLRVEQLGAQVGQIDLRDVPQVLGDGGVSILDGGRVLLRRGPDDVGALQGVASGLPQVVHHGPVPTVGEYMRAKRSRS